MFYLKVIFYLSVWCSNLTNWIGIWANELDVVVCGGFGGFVVNIIWKCVHVSIGMLDPIISSYKVTTNVSVTY